MSFQASDVIPFSQARANLSDLAMQVKAGAEKIITKNGESYVALITDLKNIPSALHGTKPEKAWSRFVRFRLVFGWLA